MNSSAGEVHQAAQIWTCLNSGRVGSSLVKHFSRPHRVKRNEAATAPALECKECLASERCCRTKAIPRRTKAIDHMLLGTVFSIMSSTG
jgi:hypothetical protein